MNGSFYHYNCKIKENKLVENSIKTTSFTPPSVIKLHLLFAHAFTCFGLLVHVKACANNKCNLNTLGGVNEVVLIVLTSVTDQK
jgi:hypothetical protein